MSDFSIKQIIQPFKLNFDQTLENLLTSFLPLDFVKSDIQILLDQIPTLDQRSMISALIELCKWDVLDVYPRVQKPIKCIVAERTIQQISKDEYENYFDATFIEGVGHLLMLEDPDKFNIVLEDTIQKLLNE
jgi:pimeloyl-ACP methyl ester carboxylesterase